MKSKLYYTILLVLFSGFFILSAQNQPINGTVTDASGIPLPGVNVLLKGTTTGTQTDFDGNYSLEADEGQILVFSYIGQKRQEITVGASNTINVQMEEDAQALDEVVVTALGISQEKKSLGYSTQEVDGEKLTEGRNTNALSALSGKVAGVQISSSGGPGSSTRILLRGAGSITQENRPLMVVDGIPLDNSNFNSEDAQRGLGGVDYGDASADINPDDIETMNVLKGGAAAALYGSRAQNGAIIITTKSGKKGKAVVTVNSGVSFESLNVAPVYQKLYGGGAGDPNTIEQTDFTSAVINGQTYDLVDYATDESWGPRYDPNRLVLHWDAFDPEFEDDFLNPRPWVYPKNDVNSFYNTGISYNNGVSFSQGSEKSTMRLSINNTSSKGIFPTNTVDRTNLNFTGSIDIGERLKIEAGANFTLTDGYNRPTRGYTGNSVALQFYIFGQTQLDYERLKKYKTLDGRQRTWNRTAFDNPTPRFTDNPYWVINESYSDDKRTRFYGNLGMRYDLTDKMYVSLKAYGDTFDFRNSERIAVGSQGQSQYIENDRDVLEINYESRLHYDDYFFDDKLSINAFIGTNRRDRETHSFLGISAGGLILPDLFNFSNSVETPNFTDTDSRRRTNSAFGSLSLGYNSIAYVTVTGRNDWSSTLPADNNSYFYPSVNASLVFSNLIDAPWLSLGKLRGGWASVGNDTDPYNLRTTYENRINLLGAPRFTQPNGNLNANLRPEIQNTWEVGLEMAFFRNRFKFDITFYDVLTEDLITPVQVDPGTGYDTTFSNAGSLSNKGIEALVDIVPVQTEDFSWNLTWNFSRNKNELLSLLPGVETLLITNFGFNGVSLNAVVGEPYGVIRGTNYVFDDQGNRVIGDNGLYLETQNAENLGSVLPDYNMGISNAFSYKNVDLSFLFDIQKGGHYRSITSMFGHYVGILEETAANGVRENGIVNEGVTGTVTYDNEGNYTVTDTAPNTTVVPAQQHFRGYFTGNDAQNVYDATYYKLREVSLGYTLPNQFDGPFSSVRFTAFGRNLLTWGLGFQHIDPESITGGSGNIQGGEGGVLPSTRTYGLNVELKF